MNSTAARPRREASRRSGATSRTALPTLLRARTRRVKDGTAGWLANARPAEGADEFAEHGDGRGRVAHGEDQGREGPRGMLGKGEMEGHHGETDYRDPPQ